MKNMILFGRERKSQIEICVLKYENVPLPYSVFLFSPLYSFQTRWNHKSLLSCFICTCWFISFKNNNFKEPWLKNHPHAITDVIHWTIHLNHLGFNSKGSSRYLSPNRKQQIACKIGSSSLAAYSFWTSCFWQDIFYECHFCLKWCHGFSVFFFFLIKYWALEAFSKWLDIERSLVNCFPSKKEYKPAIWP